MAGTSRNVAELVSESEAENSEEESIVGEYESESEEDIEYNPLWSRTTQGLRELQFSRENKLLVPIPGNNTPIDWFLLLMDDVHFETIMRQTNKYALEVFFSPSLTPQSRINRWKDVTVDELKVFVGLIFHMGTVRVNRIQDYWKTDEMFNFTFVRDRMYRDRFLLILRCLHFSSNQTQTEDRLHKIRILIDSFNNKMLNIYYPCKELSLDESMVLWRGRLVFRQYLKGKRHKYGMKLYALCEPTGLVVKFTVFSGAGGELSGKGHASKVVLHLMQGKLNVGHSIYMDNYYTSFPLASKLLSKKTYCTGTVRSDRKFLPEEVIMATLNEGESVQR